MVAYRDSPSGLPNTGSYCYFNAALQVIARIFHPYTPAHGHLLRTTKVQKTDKLIAAIVNLICHIWTDESAESVHALIETLRQELAIDARNRGQFSAIRLTQNVQEDAVEILLQIIEGIEAEESTPCPATVSSSMETAWTHPGIGDRTMARTVDDFIHFLNASYMQNNASVTRTHIASVMALADYCTSCGQVATLTPSIQVCTILTMRPYAGANDTLEACVFHGVCSATIVHSPNVEQIQCVVHGGALIVKTGDSTNHLTGYPSRNIIIPCSKLNIENEMVVTVSHKPVVHESPEPPNGWGGLVFTCDEKTDDVVSLLSQQFEPEEVSDFRHGQICPDARCGRMSRTRRLIATRASMRPIFMLNVARFDNQSHKLQTPISFPIGRENGGTDLCISYGDGGPSTRYTLIAVLLHHGQTLQSGHYTSLVQSPLSRKWFNCNDSTITEVVNVAHATKLDYVRRNTYLLVYSEVGADARSPDGRDA